MMSYTVRIEGLSEVKAGMENLLPPNRATTVMRRVLMLRAQPIAAHAESMAPRLSGILKAKVIASSRLTRRQFALHRKVERDDVEVFVGVKKLPYAHLTEYGTSRQRAQPFMRPAWDTARAKILHDLASDMWKEIKRQAAIEARRTARLSVNK